MFGTPGQRGALYRFATPAFICFSLPLAWTCRNLSPHPSPTPSIMPLPPPLPCPSPAPPLAPPSCPPGPTLSCRGLSQTKASMTNTGLIQLAMHSPLQAAPRHGLPAIKQNVPSYGHIGNGCNHAESLCNVCRAMGFLTTASPCALALVPLAYVSAIGAVTSRSVDPAGSLFAVKLQPAIVDCILLYHNICPPVVAPKCCAVCILFKEVLPAEPT